MSAALGNHILVEFTGCVPEIMNDVAAIERDMVEAAKEAGATVINSTFHHFSPYGVSGVVVIQESHLAIHTWPEYGYAAVDLFTCGDQVDAWVSFDLLKDRFQAKNYSALEMKRGAINLLKRLDFDLSAARDSVEEKLSDPKFKRNVWFTDRDEDQALSLRYTGDVLYEESTPYQKVRVLDTYAYGKMLVLDEMVMTTEKDEFHYHEMISHPAVFSHGNAKNILVIGGGDGGSVRELLKHDSVEKVTMVEIDEKVIEACKEHLPSIAASFDHPKLDLIIGDGIEFVNKAADGAYDIVIVDGSDPVGPAEGLFSTDFYKDCYRIIADKGILVAQGESPHFNENAFVEVHQTLEDIFGEDRAFVNLFFAPTYPTGMWSFQWGIKGDYDPTDLTGKDDAIKDFTSSQNLRYYNERVHRSAFALPGFVSEMLDRKTQLA